MELQCVAVLHLYYLLFSLSIAKLGVQIGAGVLELQWTTRRIYSEARVGNFWHQRSNRWWWITKVSRLLLHQKHPALQVGTISQKIMCSNWFTGREGKKLCLLFVEGDACSISCFLMFFLFPIVWGGSTLPGCIPSGACWYLLDQYSILGLLQVSCTNMAVQLTQILAAELLANFPFRSFGHYYGFDMEPDHICCQVVGFSVIQANWDPGYGALLPKTQTVSCMNQTSC